MTIAELITQLQQFDSDSRVVLWSVGGFEDVRRVCDNRADDDSDWRNLPDDAVVITEFEGLR